jgi:type I restriction enzyme S subunit
MSSEWNSAKLSEITTKIGSGQTPRGGKDAYKGGDYALIRSQNIYNYGFSAGGLAYIDQTQAEELSNVEVRPGDVLLNITGDSVARCCGVPEWVIPARVNQHVCILRSHPACLDSGFLRYFLVTPSCQWRLLALASGGATRNALTKGMLDSFEITFPPVPEQKAIAHILGTLDDKIELNRKTNETLEAMAKALFKSWFVDFDPVRAKAEGRPTGVPAEISDLFPDSFVDSELGEIPSGWRVQPLSDIFSIQGGSQPPAKTFVDFPGNGYVRLLQIRDFLGDNHLTYVPESKNLRLVGEDDVLIGRYGSGSGKFMDDSLGRPLRGLSGAINVAVVKTLPKQKNMIELIYCMVLSGWFYRQIVGGSSRAVQAGFRKEDLDLIPFPMPPNSILDAFQEIGNNFWHRTKALDVQTKSLCQIRDTLLPKLISGEIRIPDAEKMLEEVGV